MNLFIDDLLSRRASSTWIDEQRCGCSVLFNGPTWAVSSSNFSVLCSIQSSKTGNSHQSLIFRVSVIAATSSYLHIGRYMHNSGKRSGDHKSLMASNLVPAASLRFSPKQGVVSMGATEQFRSHLFYFICSLWSNRLNKANEADERRLRLSQPLSHRLGGGTWKRVQHQILTPVTNHLCQHKFAAADCLDIKRGSCMRNVLAGEQG